MYLNLSTDGIYSNKMTSSSNKITIPTRTNYNFGGYYTKPNGEGIQIIDSNGYIAKESSKTQYTGTITLYAKWTRK